MLCSHHLNTSLEKAITFQAINQAARYCDSPVPTTCLPEGVWLLLGIHLHRPILELAAHAEKATRHETDDVAIALGLTDVAARGRGFHMSRQCAGCFEVAGTARAAVLDPRVGLDVDDERVFEEITLPAIVVSEIDVEPGGGGSRKLTRTWGRGSGICCPGRPAGEDVQRGRC